MGNAHVQLSELSSEKRKLHLEKIDLENQLEAEQEYVVNKLQKRVRTPSQPFSHSAKEEAPKRALASLHSKKHK